MKRIIKSIVVYAIINFIGMMMWAYALDLPSGSWEAFLNLPWGKLFALSAILMVVAFESSRWTLGK